MTKERKALELYRLIAITGYDQASAVAEIVAAITHVEKDAERRGFKNGYLIACCNLANLHDRAELANDVLAEGGITKSEAAQMELSEYDQRALDRIRKARSKDPLCNGYREIINQS